MTEEPGKYKLSNPEWDEERDGDMNEFYEKLTQKYESIVPYNRNQFVSNPYFKWCACFAEAYVKSGEPRSPEEIANAAVQLTEALINQVQKHKPTEQLKLDE